MFLSLLFGTVNTGRDEMVLGLPMTHFLIFENTDLMSIGTVNELRKLVDAIGVSFFVVDLVSASLDMKWAKFEGDIKGVPLLGIFAC